MSLKTYKTIKAATQLAGATAGIYAMTLRADPLAVLTLVTIMVSGPEVLELLINQEQQ